MCAVTERIQDPFGVVSSDRGFLPLEDPLERLGKNSNPSVTSSVEEDEIDGWEAAPCWEKLVMDLPKLSVAAGSGTLQKAVASLPPFPSGTVWAAMTGAQRWKVYQMLSFAAHAYIWCEPGAPTPQSLPSNIAVPWVNVSESLGMPPVLVYSTSTLFNWKRLDPTKPIELGNIACLHNFLGGIDEEWFRLVHVEMEARAAPALAALQPMLRAAEQCDEEGVLKGLRLVHGALLGMQASLSRIGEKCDPYIYYTRVRRPMNGWKGNPMMPQGLLYEGAGENGSPLRLSLQGETGTQSSVLPALEAALGLPHEQEGSKDSMRPYMPPAHRRLLTQLETRGTGARLRQMCSAGSPSAAAAAALHASLLPPPLAVLDFAPPQPASSVARGMSGGGGAAATLLEAAPKAAAVSVAAAARGVPVLSVEACEAYRECLVQLDRFRAQHKAFVHSYFGQWGDKESNN